MAAKTHGYKGYTTLKRHLLKLHDFLPRDQPIEKFTTTETSMKFWYIYSEAFFPVIIKVALLMKIFIKQALMNFILVVDIRVVLLVSLLVLMLSLGRMWEILGL